MAPPPMMGESVGLEWLGCPLTRQPAEAPASTVEPFNATPRSRRVAAVETKGPNAPALGGRAISLVPSGQAFGEQLTAELVASGFQIWLADDGLRTPPCRAEFENGWTRSPITGWDVDVGQDTFFRDPRFAICRVGPRIIVDLTPGTAAGTEIVSVRISALDPATPSVGTVVPSWTIKVDDDLFAVVRQIPMPGQGQGTAGSTCDLWLSVERAEAIGVRGMPCGWERRSRTPHR